MDYRTPLKKASQARRCLFGGGSAAENLSQQNWLDAKLEAIKTESMKKWSFDFDSDRPCSSGSENVDMIEGNGNDPEWQWVKVEGWRTPVFYTERTIPAKNRTSSLKKDTAPREFFLAPGQNSKRLPAKKKLGAKNVDTSGGKTNSGGKIAKVCTERKSGGRVKRCLNDYYHVSKREECMKRSKIQSSPAKFIHLSATYGTVENQDRNKSVSSSTMVKSDKDKNQLRILQLDV